MKQLVSIFIAYEQTHFSCSLGRARSSLKPRSNKYKKTAIIIKKH